jgi:glycosyltransferase involved in cell wall biosynthesis
VTTLLRIAVITRFVTRVGGVETYLEHVLPKLRSKGHAVGVWYECKPEPGSDRYLPDAIPAWHLDQADLAAMVTTLTKWRPDVVFLHGLSSSSTEVALEGIAPLVIFLHGYHGTCISGTKTRAFPSATPCSHTLGPACLMRYYPQRCGGWSPVSMWSHYKQQRTRQSLLARCTLVTTLSEHMRREVIAHGVSPNRAVTLPVFTPADVGAADEQRVPTTESAHERSDTRQWHLLFAGRMETLKGGQIFLEALDQIDRPLRHRVRVIFAGEGRERKSWEKIAAASSLSTLDIRFVGPYSGAGRARVFAGVDLLVVPSVWPEPLGLVGLEAAAAGIPAVAFDVGGIREWLSDAVTGRLLKPAGRWSSTLARGLEDCLSDPVRLRAWGDAARVRSAQRTLSAHVNVLETVLGRAARMSIAEPSQILEGSLA